MLGAGAAGLSAARALSHSGRRVVVVEARPRLGGRILTLHDPAWPLPVELGAEFLHGAAEETRRAADAAGAKVVELPDVHVWASRGRLRPMEHVWKPVVRLFASGSRLRRDVPFAEWLAGRRAAPLVKQTARLFVEGYAAARSERVSTRWMAAGAEQLEHERQYRLEGGYHAVIAWLRAGLDPERVRVRLSTLATSVEWARGRVRVALRSATGRALEPIDARAAVVTLPLGVLKAPPGSTGALQFRPAVPRLAATLARLEPGPVRKLLLRFREAFWDEPGFMERRLPKQSRHLSRTVTFLHDGASPFPTWWTAGPRRVPVITAWAGGPAAEALAGLETPALADRALDALARTLRVARNSLDDGLEGWAEHDWQRDPFSRGAYGYVAVGGMDAPARLARPVEGTLFFAGEAAEPDQMGTVAGAIASGLAAARKVEAAL